MKPSYLQSHQRNKIGKQNNTQKRWRKEIPQAQHPRRSISARQSEKSVPVECFWSHNQKVEDEVRHLSVSELSRKKNMWWDFTNESSNTKKVQVNINKNIFLLLSAFFTESIYRKNNVKVDIRASCRFFLQTAFTSKIFVHYAFPTSHSFWYQYDPFIGYSHDGQIDVCRLVAMVIWS